jgi:glucose 1-dehydrogenase
MAGPFTGKVGLVTGASSGIGQATALALAQGGADVAINYNSNDAAAEKTAAEIRKLGRKASLQKVNVADPHAVEKMVADVVAQLGRLDLFVSSAVYSHREPFLTADLEKFRKTIDVSLFGAFYCLQAACNQMVKQGQGGSVVIVSSPHAQIAFPNAMAYNIAKAGLDQMMRSAARELLKHRIRVNGCYPGWTDTPGERNFFTEEQIQQGGKELPWGRLATSEEVARAIVFLLDPASDYINGSILHVDGGLFLPFWSKRDEEGF